ncbi:MAG: hypothetical protein IJ136_01070 [Erysipelotrichaceae bacterium]|nr:hypothetical protein [Erysipelotrichaceae bacterium]
MKRKVEGYNVDDSYREMFMKCLEYENERRNRLSQKKLNKSEFIVQAINYYYDHEVNETNRKRKEEYDAQHYASITKKLVEKYFNTLTDEMEFIAGKLANTEFYLKLLSDFKSRFDDIDDRKLSRMIEEIKEDDEIFRRLKSIYDRQNKEELFSVEDIEGVDDDDEGRQIF